MNSYDSNTAVRAQASAVVSVDPAVNRLLDKAIQLFQQMP
jgi:hypothetical protein